jgi:hypothetical protein
MCLQLKVTQYNFSRFATKKSFCEEISHTKILQGFDRQAYGKKTMFSRNLICIIFAKIL